MSSLDWIVVGADFTGTTFAERMAAAGKRVLVIERRVSFPVVDRLDLG